MGLRNLLHNVQATTDLDMQLHGGTDDLIRNTGEEFGEYCAAVTIEIGRKKKELREPSKMEAVDLILCAFSLYFASGGTPLEFEADARAKLAKWNERLFKELDGEEFLRTCVEPDGDGYKLRETAKKLIERNNRVCEDC